MAAIGIVSDFGTVVPNAKDKAYAEYMKVQRNGRFKKVKRYVDGREGHRCVWCSLAVMCVSVCASVRAVYLSVDVPYGVCVDRPPR